MNVNPLVSIIIPSYNRAHLIGETLDSVLAQTYQNWECIVVDDGSTDATASVVAAYLKKDARFQYHQRPENRSKGGNAARNYGLEISRGNFLFFLDSDDLLTLDCITNRVFVTIENENYNFYVFQSLLFDKVKDDLKIIPNVLSKEGVSDLERFISYDYPWNISAAFYRAKFIVENNMIWDEKLLKHQDLDFNIRILLITNKYFKINKYPDVYIRMGGDDKISKDNYSSLSLNNKFIFLDKIINTISSKDKKLNYRLYGLVLNYALLFFDKSYFILILKTWMMLLKNKYYFFFLVFSFDLGYLILCKKIKIVYPKRVLKKYQYYLGKKRLNFIPPKDSTLGVVKLNEYLEKMNSLG